MSNTRVEFGRGVELRQRKFEIIHCLQNSVENIADLSACNSPQEVYVVLKAGFFAKNSDLYRQA